MIFYQLKGFLDFLLWCGIGTLSMKTLIAMYQCGMLQKGYKGVIKLMSESNIKSIPLDNEHTCVFGITRHGKTFAVMHTLNKLSEGVLFFNVQHEKVPSGFITADGNTTEQQLIFALRNRKKVNFLPESDFDKMQKQLSAIINMLYENGMGWDIRLVVDEVQLFEKQALKDCKKVATTGLRRGIRAVWISQRPALVDNTLYSQATSYVFFVLSMADYEYLKKQGLPVENVKVLLNNEKYKFVMFNQKEVKGAYKIKV